MRHRDGVIADVFPSGKGPIPSDECGLRTRPLMFLAEAKASSGSFNPDKVIDYLLAT
jgi:hypothetical protein